MKYKLIYSFIFLSILVLLSIFLVNAETEMYQVNQNISLKLTCTINNGIPANSTLNITINYPNGTAFIDNKQAISKGNGEFNYSVNFPILGLYHAQVFCWSGSLSGSNSGDYEITPTGFKLDTSKSIVIFLGLGIMLLIGVLLFIFGIYAKGIVKVFSIGLSILLIAFSFGYTINILNAGIGEYTGLINSFSGLYFLITVLLSVGGIGLILFLIYAAFQYFNKLRGFKD